MFEKYIIPILDKKENFEKHKKVILGEVKELIEAIEEHDPEHMLEELQDVVQGCVGLADELKEQGYNVHQANLKHQKKLINRGWKCKGHLEIKVFKTKY